MRYTVKPGDTLWQLAATYFGDPAKWTAIAEDNRLPLRGRIYVGEVLHLRDALLTDEPVEDGQTSARPPQGPEPEHKPSVIPARAFLFVLADEVDPTRQKVVRRVIVSPKMAARVSAQLGRPVELFANPERYGFTPKEPQSSLPMRRHAQGMKNSPFVSASKHPLGTRRISGKPFWIDVAKAKAAGATFHDTHEILDDLDRMRRRGGSSRTVARVNYLKSLVRGDAEVLFRGKVPPGAIKGATAMALTRGLQGVQVVGFVFTAVDLGRAGVTSARMGSFRPITAETVRQVGGWSAAWGGMKLGGAAGAAFGLETGPGAVLTGAAGMFVGGVAGYLGFDWVADHIHEN